MRIILFYSAFGWLGFSAVMLFGIDVVGQHLRGVRQPGDDTTQYYGLNTAYAFGQIVFAALGALLTWRSPTQLAEMPFVALAVAAAVGWVFISAAFMTYWQPKVNAGIFALFVLAATFAH